MEVVAIILRTEDVDRSTAFWSERVGLSVDSQIPGYTFLNGGKIPIILSAIDAVADQSMTEVVLGVEDVREAYQAMTDRGVAFETELTMIMSDEGRDLLGASFLDPDGHYGTLQGWVDSAEQT